MRYAVLSDIHANLEALSIVLTALATERIDRYLCLGDIVGYGAEPGACLARLQACNAVIVGGNHELACVGKLELEWFHELARTSLVWTRDQLSFMELDALRRLPLTAIVEPFTLVHSSLKHPERFAYLVDAALMVETMQACSTLICLAGHTHQPCVVEYDRVRRQITRMLLRPEEVAEVAFVDDPERLRYLVNPGSVGQPRDGDPRAGVAVIDTGRKTIAIHRLPYDAQTAANKIRQAGLPPLLSDRLLLGR